MSIRILYIGEIVGKSGIWCVKNLLPQIKRTEKPDLVIANGDGVTGSYGLGRQHAGYLRKLGVDIITGGDCIYYKKDLVEGFDSIPYVLRPVNFPVESPGRGWRYAGVGDKRVAVVSMLGRAGFSRVHGDNPFTMLPALADRLHQETPYIVIDFHSGATAEKQAFFYHADGKVSAVIGSHGRVQTSDAQIFPGGCGIITDAGRTGSLNSVAGTDALRKIRGYISGIPEWSGDAWDDPALQGVFFELNESGKTSCIRSIRMDCPIAPVKTAKEGENARKSTSDTH